MTVCTTNMQQATPVAPVTLNEGWKKITARLTHLEDGLFGAGRLHAGLRRRVGRQRVRGHLRRLRRRDHGQSRLRSRLRQLHRHPRDQRGRRRQRVLLQRHGVLRHLQAGLLLPRNDWVCSGSRGFSLPLNLRVLLNHLCHRPLRFRCVSAPACASPEPLESSLPSSAAFPRWQR